MPLAPLEADSRVGRCRYLTQTAGSSLCSGRDSQCADPAGRGSARVCALAVVSLWCIQDLYIYCTQSLSLSMRGGGVSGHLVSYMPDALGLA